GGGHALSPAAPAHARLLGHVLEGPVPLVVEQGGARRRAAPFLDGGAVGQEDVEPAVAVVVEEGHPRSRGLEDVGARLLLAVGRLEVESSGGGPIREGDRPGPRIGRPQDRGAGGGEEAPQAEDGERGKTNPGGNHPPPPGVYHARTRSSSARRCGRP